MSHDTSPSVPFDQRIRMRVVQGFVLLAIPCVAVSRPVWADGSAIYEILEFGGLACLLLCVFGRLWSILYSGGRKNVRLIMEGPYSITRNPLYFFSTLGAIGIGLLLGSVVLAILFGGMTCAVFVMTARGEARFLQARFGDVYRDYARRVPFFWPTPSLYDEAQTPVFDPKALRRTVLDASYFLLVIPMVELVEYLRGHGLMPDLYPIF